MKVVVMTSVELPPPRRSTSTSGSLSPLYFHCFSTPFFKHCSVLDCFFRLFASILVSDLLPASCYCVLLHVLDCLPLDLLYKLLLMDSTPSVPNSSLQLCTDWTLSQLLSAPYCFRSIFTLSVSQLKLEKSSIPASPEIWPPGYFISV